MSTNGSVFYLGTSKAIYKSVNNGSSWTNNSVFDLTPPTYNQWYALATNSDGTKVLAANTDGYLYLSDNGGATFVAQVSVGTGSWKQNSVDMTPDGAGLIACSNDGYVWISINGGSWEQQIQGNMGSKLWMSVSCSSDFQVLGAVVDNGYVYVSTDGGSSWTQQTDIGSSNWRAILISEISGVCFRDSTRGDSTCPHGRRNIKSNKRYTKRR